MTIMVSKCDVWWNGMVITLQIYYTASTCTIPGVSNKHRYSAKMSIRCVVQLSQTLFAYELLSSWSLFSLRYLEQHLSWNHSAFQRSCTRLLNHTCGVLISLSLSIVCVVSSSPLLLLPLCEWCDENLCVCVVCPLSRSALPLDITWPRSYLFLVAPGSCTEVGKTRNIHFSSLWPVLSFSPLQLLRNDPLLGMQLGGIQPNVSLIQQPCNKAYFLKGFYWNCYRHSVYSHFLMLQYVVLMAVLC